MSIYNVLTVLFKYKKKIILIFMTASIAVTVVTFLLDSVYQAKSTLLVKALKQDESRPGISASTSDLRLVAISQEEMVNTEIQILTGRELAERVISTLKLETIYPDLVSTKDPNLWDTAMQFSRELKKKVIKVINALKKENPDLTTPAGDPIMDKAVKAFGDSLTVNGIRKSNVVNVVFQHKDPKIAARAVNLLVEMFKEKHVAVHSDPQSSFIGTQFTSFENKLKESERSLQDFQQTNNAFSLEEQRSLLLKQRTDLDTIFKTASNNVRELRNKISSTKGQLKYITNNNTRYTGSNRDEIIIGAKSKLLELQLKEEELSKKYTGTNRLVVDAKNDVALVDKFLKEQEEGITGKVKTGNPVYQSIETDLFRAEGELNSQIARTDAVKNQLKQLDMEIAQLDMSENKIQNLRREIAINEKNYKTYADRQEDARISEAMNRLKLSNISVIQTAVTPVDPVKPKKLINMAVGAFLGILSGLAFAFVSENITQTFLDPESVEKYLDLPVLLTVPHKEV